MILFDPDWNPAIDNQALARVWRSGQQKPCYVYRFFGVGTLEEVCYERQVAKEGLAGEVVDGDAESRKFSSDELKSLFSPNFDSRSNFHDRDARLPANPARPASPPATIQSPVLVSEGAGFESRDIDSKCPCCRLGVQPPDANGMTHALPGSKELQEADPPLANAATNSGRVSLTFFKVTDAGGKGFARASSA